MPLSLAHTRMEHKHPHPEFHTDADYQRSIERSKQAQHQERAAAIARVPALASLLRVDVRPLRASRIPLAQRVACADYVDEGVERFGVQTVVRALCAVLAANKIDIMGKTLDELAQGSEEQ